MLAGRPGRTITDEGTGKVDHGGVDVGCGVEPASAASVDDGSAIMTIGRIWYDASGQRWAKIEHPTDVTLPTQATVYLGDTEITDTDTFANDATSM